MNSLDDEYTKMKEALKELLSKQKFVCLTADVWSARAQSYLGVTVHFINPETFQNESYVLAFQQIKFKQTYNALGKAIKGIMEDYGIKKSQVTNIVTDGGSAFCKMFKVYGTPIDEQCFEVNVNNIHEGEDADQIEPGTVTDFMEDINGDFFVTEILDFTDRTEASYVDTDFLDFSDDATSEEFNLPEQRRCISHECNLLSQDFLKKHLTGNAKTNLVHSLSKLHTLWVLTHRSSKAKSICQEILGRCLKVPCETRWNSRFDAVKMCMEPEIQKKLNTLIQKLKDTLTTCETAKNLQLLTKNDIFILSMYLKVSEPVAQSLDVMQREANSCQGLIIPVLLSMKHRVQRIDESSTTSKEFKNAMLKGIEARMQKYIDLDKNNDLLLASLSLPRIKCKFIEKDDDIIYAKRLLVNECKKFRETTSIEHCTENLPVNSEDDFIISFSDRRNIRRDSIDSEIESEVARFLCDPRTDSSILNEFPNIRSVYFKYNTTLCSSAPVERVFSQSMMIFTPRRNRLSAPIFEKTLLLKHNRMLLKQNRR